MMTSFLDQKTWQVKKLGIAMAVYRPNPKIFGLQLKSIQDQTYKDWVCIITSDSPLHEYLNTEEIRSFCDDKRFIWQENEKRLGHKKNFEKATQRLISLNVDAIAFSDQDDMWYPDKLMLSIQELEKRGRLSLVHCDMHVMYSDNKVDLSLSAWSLERRGVNHTQTRHLFIRNVVAGCALVMDAELARRYPVIPDGLEYHDHWYALVAAFHGGVYPLGKPLSAYRQHPDHVVGVTPFEGTFSFGRRFTWATLVKDCRIRWKKTQSIAKASAQIGLNLSLFERLIFLTSYDLGLGLFLMGLGVYRSDPALARACFARFIGKWSDFFTRTEADKAG